MKFVIEKDDFLNSLRIVEKATLGKAIQPVLSNILIEAGDKKIKFTGTDLDMTIVSFGVAQVKEEGKITLPAKTLIDIASKIPDKPVEFELNPESQMVKIVCGSVKFEFAGISAEEFPAKSTDEADFKGYKEIKTDAKPFIQSIKKTAFAAANYETKNIISGVYCNFTQKELEMAATDGNRLAQCVEPVQSKIDEDTAVVIPARTLQEVQRIYALEGFENITVYLDKSQIIFKLNDVYLFSRLLEGQYPPYKQLIPKTCSKHLIADREAVVKSLECVAVMVNEKMNIVKFHMEDNKLSITADKTEGMSEDVLDVDYKYEEMTIAFNYRYVLDCLKVMDSEKIKIGLNGSLSASLFKPESDENYLCLIMPIQIR